MYPCLQAVTIIRLSEGTVNLSFTHRNILSNNQCQDAINGTQFLQSVDFILLMFSVYPWVLDNIVDTVMLNIPALCHVTSQGMRTKNLTNKLVFLSFNHDCFDISHFVPCHYFIISYVLFASSLRTSEQQGSRQDLSLPIQAPPHPQSSILWTALWSCR